MVLFCLFVEFFDFCIWKKNEKEELCRSSPFFLPSACLAGRLKPRSIVTEKFAFTANQPKIVRLILFLHLFHTVSVNFLFTNFTNTFLLLCQQTKTKINKHSIKIKVNNMKQQNKQTNKQDWMNKSDLEKWKKKQNSNGRVDCKRNAKGILS